MNEIMRERELEQSETTLRDHLRVLFRQKFIIILSFATVLAAVYAGLELQTPKYEARVKMLITAQKQVESPYTRELDNSRNAQMTVTQSEIVKSLPVIERTVQALGLQTRPIDAEKRFATPLKNILVDREIKKFKERIKVFNPEQQEAFYFRRAVDTLKSNVDVVPVRDTFLFNITVTDYDPFLAATIANTISRSYIIFDLEQQLSELKIKYGNRHPSIIQMKDRIADRVRSLNGQTLPVDEAMGPATVKILEQATVPFMPVGPSRVASLTLAVILGLILGIILAYIFDFLDPTVKAPSDLENRFHLPLLGTIPKRGWVRKKVFTDPTPNWFTRKSNYWKSYHNLVDQIMLLVANKQVKSILFTSPETRQGVTTTVSNVAYFLSQQGGQKVLVIDANFHNTRLHKTFKVEKSPGLYEVLTSQVTFDQAVKEVNPSLSMIPVGNTHPRAVDLQKIQDIIDVAKSRFDIILIDCADMKSYKDSLALSSFVDGVVFLVSEGKTRISVVRHSLSPLREGHCNVLGAILNNRTYPIPRIIYDRV